MSGPYSLTLKEIADKLNVGESTLNVWRNRYMEWLSGVSDDTVKMFSEDAVEVFKLISACTESGLAPEQIETALSRRDVLPEKNGAVSDARDSDTEGGQQPVAFGGEFARVVSTLLSDVVSQQRRIADAQERRAEAEERKAYALESRAEAELVKANVMREIADSLKDLAVKGAVSSLMDKVKSMPGPSSEMLQDLKSDFGLDEIDMDSLPELTEADQVNLETLTESGTGDTLPALAEPDEAGLPSEPERAGELPGVDEKDAVDESVDIDDLSQLLEPSDLPPAEDIDDLSLLIDEEIEKGDDIDDLSTLIDEELRAEEDINDISAIIDESESVSSGDIDDLSRLIDDVVGETDTQDIDDLSLLIDGEPETGGEAEPKGAGKGKKQVKQEPVKETKPESGGDYKSKILKRIIMMKQKEGLSIEETTKIFNDEGVKTLSGKGTWDVKTIAGIYKYIDSGKVGG